MTYCRSGSKAKKTLIGFQLLCIRISSRLLTSKVSAYGLGKAGPFSGSVLNGESLS